jgi:hypothetical protein
MRACRRARLDVLTGSFDGGAVAPCAHCAAGAHEHVGASKRRCAQVRLYRYRSPNLSLCERLFLNRFWDWLVTGGVVPPWMAPNLMTVSGLACIVLA